MERQYNVFKLELTAVQFHWPGDRPQISFRHDNPTQMLLFSLAVNCPCSNQSRHSNTSSRKREVKQQFSLMHFNSSICYYYTHSRPRRSKQRRKRKNGWCLSQSYPSSDRYHHLGHICTHFICPYHISHGR